MSDGTGKLTGSMMGRISQSWAYMAHTIIALVCRGYVSTAAGSKEIVGVTIGNLRLSEGTGRSTGNMLSRHQK